MIGGKHVAPRVVDFFSRCPSRAKKGGKRNAEQPYRGGAGVLNRMAAKWTRKSLSLWREKE